MCGASSMINPRRRNSAPKYPSRYENRPNIPVSGGVHLIAFRKDRREAVFLFAVHWSRLALRDISRHRINSVAFGAKRTFNKRQSAGPFYEYAP
jgi:hypothetical protein